MPREPRRPPPALHLHHHHVLAARHRHKTPPGPHRHLHACHVAPAPAPGPGKGPVVDVQARSAPPARVPGPQPALPAVGQQPSPRRRVRQAPHALHP
ncbi:MAG: hypothetical protein ACK56I_21530, partial [bacterium]